MAYPHIMEDMPNETAALQQKFLRLKQSIKGRWNWLWLRNICWITFLRNGWKRMICYPLRKENVICQWKLLISVHQWGYCLFCNAPKKGYYPLLAHPERYEYMQKKDYKILKEEHISFQLNVLVDREIRQTCARKGRSLTESRNV